jgi:RNA recognition motif-containing protein
MEKRLYVGNLPFDTTEDDLHQLFSAHGQIVSAKLITDMETGRSRGFGFVEMSSEDEAKAAIEKMNKAKVGERELTVNEARPRPEKSGGRGGFGGGRSSGGGFGGGNGGGYGGGRSSGGGFGGGRGGNRY